MFRFRNTKQRNLALISLAVALIFTSITLVMIVEETILRPPSTPIPPQLLDIVAERTQYDIFFAWIYKSSPYLATATWIAFLALIWKGRIRILWRKHGYDYDIFKLLVKMRGGSARVKILRSLFIPKNRLQLAKECEMDWKAINRHMYVLIKHSFIKQVITFGNAKYLMITDKGKEILNLLDNSEDARNNQHE